MVLRPLVPAQTEPVLDGSFYGWSSSWFHRGLGKACNWYKNEGVSALQ